MALIDNFSTGPDDPTKGPCVTLIVIDKRTGFGSSLNLIRRLINLRQTIRCTSAECNRQANGIRGLSRLDQATNQPASNK